MAAAGARALHWVFKIASRQPTIQFYKALGMKPLRHEEFEKGCEASCNGPYDGKWSKTMIGYGDEDNHFVVELTYNYGIKQYELGNDYQWITIKSPEAISRLRSENYPLTEASNGAVFASAPDGYRFKLLNEAAPSGTDPVQSLTLHVSNLQRSLEFWSDTLGMKLLSKTTDDAAGTTTAVLSFGDHQASLELVEKASNNGAPINHAVAFGRIAFAIPSASLSGIQETIQKKNYTILTPLISLDTPGKATVHVVILADPDGYEICFVGDEAFRELSRTDLKADELLATGIAADKSDEWFAKRAQRTSLF